jgi:outer membrane protein
LQGLGDVDWTLEVGGFAEYWPTDWLRTRLEVRRGFNGHEGIVADLTADLVVPLMERWMLSGGPRVTLADSKATAPYFSIDAAQSLASALPEFDAKGGVRSVGAGAQVRYQWTP